MHFFKIFNIEEDCTVSLICCPVLSDFQKNNKHLKCSNSLQIKTYYELRI